MQTLIALVMVCVQVKEDVMKKLEYVHVMKDLMETAVKVSKGAFKNYVDRRGWVGGKSNVYKSK